MQADDTKETVVATGVVVDVPTDPLPAQLIVRPSEAVERRVNSGAPMVRPALAVVEVLSAFEEYQRLKDGLDKLMPDAIMTIEGRKFRKAAYWRAVGVAFNLDIHAEHEDVSCAGEDWGYVVSYRATAPNGRFVVADGTAFASERTTKSGRVPSVHVVRALAHTRAFSRAVSCLVGFGEVSAEEAEADAPSFSPSPSPAVSRSDRGAPLAAAVPRPPPPPPRAPGRSE